MAVKGFRLAVAKTATRISQTENDATTGNSVIITNATPCDLFLGGSGVTNAGANIGAKLPAGSTGQFGLTQGDDILYGCVPDANDGALFDILVMGV